MNSLSFLDQYIVAVNASVAVVDAWYFKQLNNQTVANMKVINQIEESINETYDVMMSYYNKQLIATIDEEEEIPNDQHVVKYMCNDYKNIYNLSVYDVTYDFEHEYDFIKPIDIDTDKRKYCEDNFDGYEFIYSPEHDTDKLLADGWQRIHGIAEQYKYNERGKLNSIGAFYKTSPNSGIYADVNGSSYMWSCNGSRCWLSKVPSIDDGLEHNYNYESETEPGSQVTFDYNYNLYIRLRCYNPEEESRQQVFNLHTKVVELQKELAEIKRNSERHE